MCFVCISHSACSLFFLPLLQDRCFFLYFVLSPQSDSYLLSVESHPGLMNQFHAQPATHHHCQRSLVSWWTKAFFQDAPPLFDVSVLHP